MKTDFLSTPVERMIRAATRAPSSLNSQPWKFTADHDEIRIFPDFYRHRPVTDPAFRELIVSLGCALENLVLAARHEGFAVDIRMFPGDLDGIIVRLRPMLFSPGGEKEALF